MKKKTKVILAIALALICILAATVFLLVKGKFFGGYYLAYEVNADNKTCTVTKCIPLGTKEIAIPETIGHYRVTEIAPYAFANRQKLTNVSLPDGITTIGMGAFYECSSLMNISVPKSVASIGSYAFYNCVGLTSITLSETLSDIGAHMFDGCTEITSATVPASAISALPAENITSLVVNGGTSIGSAAFRNFVNLTNITLSPSIETIAKGAFQGCNNITSATIPTGLISFIPKYKLMHVVINGGTHIAEKAFQNYSYLTSITLPPSITSIGDAAFENCYRLVEVYNLSSLEITQGSLDNGGVGRYALNIYTSADEKSKTWNHESGYLFYEDDNICYLLGYMGKETELVLPKDCNGKGYVIRDSAFYIDSHITAVTFSDGVLKIEDYAFAHCTELKNITFPDSLISIGEYAFVQCDALEEISFGKAISAIGAFAFDECYNLMHVYFRGTTEEWSRVETGGYWIYYTPATEVTCINGAVVLK